MKLTKTVFEGVYILEPDVYPDERGFFMEMFNRKKFVELTGMEIDFIQDNLAQSKKGVLRGLHFQIAEYAQAKLVTVLKGKVQDVIVDMRPGSSTYKKSMSIILSANNKKQLFIPRGFAHGYLSLEDETLFYYKIDNQYCQKAEGGIYYGDEELGIDWLIKKEELILSEKDKKLPIFKEWENAR